MKQQIIKEREREREEIASTDCICTHASPASSCMSCPLSSNKGILPKLLWLYQHLLPDPLLLGFQDIGFKKMVKSS
jgi:hypothetical protein